MILNTYNKLTYLTVYFYAGGLSWPNDTENFTDAVGKVRSMYVLTEFFYVVSIGRYCFHVTIAYI